jgi:hypothetical protein
MLDGMLGLGKSARTTLALATFFAWEPHFGGCEQAREVPADPVPLPMFTMSPCTGDDECRADRCIDARCLGGQCFVIEPTIDRDRDGEQAIPCGGDCDDADADVRPERNERCNARDDDCDTRIDEAATAVSTTLNFVQGGPLSVGAPFGDGDLLVIGNPTNFMPAYFVGPDGRVDGPTNILGLLAGGLFSAPQIVRGTGDRYLVTYRTDDSRLLAAVVQRSGPRSVTIVEPVGMLDTSVGVDPVTIAFGDTFALLVDAFDTSGAPERYLRLWSDAAAIYASPGGLETRELATDGTNLVVREGSDLVFLSRTGDEVGRHTMSFPSLASATSRLVVSGEGAVYAIATGGGAVPAIFRVTATGAPEELFDAMPTGTADLFLFLTGPFFLVVSLEASQVDITALDAETGALVDRRSAPGNGNNVTVSAAPAFGGGAVVVADRFSFVQTTVTFIEACGG